MKKQRILAGLLAGMLAFSSCTPTWATEDVLAGTEYEEGMTVAAVVGDADENEPAEETIRGIRA